MQLEPNRHLPLLPQHTFVVQFHADTQLDAGLIKGRVEHVTTHQAMWFESQEMLSAFIARVLGEMQETLKPSETCSSESSR